MSERPIIAISLAGAGKAYTLYRSPLEAMADALGCLRLLRRGFPQIHHALVDINLTVRHGERVGIIGRNGAGKTTLLKLVTSAARPTAGTVTVNGRVQSLSDLGIGFHPDFSGRDNVRSALAYNDLTEDALNTAVDDIVEFCELGAFIDMPIKVYSTGMMARLYFATATAIRPDILVVDEAFGAGDTYFAARSAVRMRQLALSGCTLLLVSHSTQQVIEFCQRAVWIERGRVVMDGPALVVIKAYEGFIQRLAHHYCESGDVARSVLHDESILAADLAATLAETNLPMPEEDTPFAAGGMSTWPASGRVKVCSVWFENEKGASSSRISYGADVTICVEVSIAKAGRYHFRCVIVIFGSDGRWITRLISPPFELSGNLGGARIVRCSLLPVQLGPDHYVLSVSLHEANQPWDLNSAERYDLLSRSFALEVVPGRELTPDTPIRQFVEWRHL